MLYEVLGDIWVVRRNPYLQDDLLDNRSAARMLIEALQPPPRTIEKRRDRADGRDAEGRPAARLGARKAVEAFRGEFRRTAACAPGAAQAAGRHTRKRQHPLRRLRARLARDRRHRLARRIPVRRAHARHRGRDPGLVRACIELGLTIIPRGGGTGYTGGAIPLTPLSRGDQHREARGAGRGGTAPLPGVARPCPPSSPRRAWSPSASRKRPSARLRVRGRSDLGRRLLHRRQHRHERRRQEGGAVGHALDNLAWWRMVDPEGNWLEVDALGHNLGKIHDAERRASSSPGRTAADAGSGVLPRSAEIPGARFRKVGLGKDVTDKFLGGLPGVQKEGCDGLITVGALGPAPMPSTPAPSAWSSSGQAREAVPAIVEIRTTWTRGRAGRRRAAGRPRAPGRALPAAVGYATKSRRGGCPRWC
jgi:hypothetical protein